MRHPQIRILNAPLRAALPALLCTAFAGGLVAAPMLAAQTVDSALYGGMRWRSIGPYRAGNVYAVAGVSTDPTVYYIGTPEGGVWKTTDGGTVWTPIFDAQHVASIGAVAAAPSSPNVVYVGTGDPTRWSFTPGNGVYKSTDAGATWRKIGLDKTLFITSIIVDPRDANTVLVGALGSGSSTVTSWREFDAHANTARGVYRTIDGGRTWKHALYVDAYTGVSNMAFDEADPQIVYAAFLRSTVAMPPAVRDSLRPLGAGLYKSIDGGATWKALSGSGLPASVRGFELAVASGTHGQRLYAEDQGAGGDAKGVYRSNDGGATWGLGTKATGSAVGRIYADPKDPDVVYLMGTAMYKSVDGARHFIATKGAPGGDDYRDLWIDPRNPRRMLLGVDQGPTISVDGGKSWTPWYNVPNGQFYYVSTDNHFPYRVCGAQQDSGTQCVLSRSDFGEIRDNDAYPVGGFEDGYIVMDPLNDRWIYTQGWYHAVRRYDRETGQVAAVYTPTSQDRFADAPPMAFSPQDPHTLYMGAQYVLVTNDSARSWRRVSPDLTTRPGKAGADSNFSRPAMFGRPYQPSIQALAVSRISAGTIWVGTNNGLVQLTRDNGTTWTNVTPPDIPARAGVNMIDASRTSAGTAYITVNVFDDSHPYAYRTTDFGHSWQSIAGGLPSDAAVRVVREDAVDPNLLYAGTETSAWISFDRGDRWQSLQLNLPNTVITDMDVHGNDLVIATFGRAFWILDDLTPLRQTHLAMAAPVSLFQPETAYRVRWDNIQDTPLPPEVPAGENPPEGAMLDYYLKSPAVGPVTVSLYDGEDHLIREYSSVAPPPDSSMPNVPSYWFKPSIVLSTAAGMHRFAWDLRYPSPPALNYGYSGGLLDYTPYTLNWHAIKGELPRTLPVGPLVVPGTYRVRLSVGGQTYTQELTVENDPRIPVTQPGLVAQLRLEQRIGAGMTVSFDEFNRLLRLRTALAADTARVRRDAGSSEVIPALRALDDSAAALAIGAHGFGPANRDLVRHLQDTEFGDVQPSAGDLAVVESNCQDIDAALAGLQRLEGAVSDLNTKLAGAHFALLPTEAPSSTSACGIR